jgi:hypothetical protein
MSVQVEEQHVEEEERFRKLQIQDTSVLNDRLDQLIVSKEYFRRIKFTLENLDECCWFSCAQSY